MNNNDNILLPKIFLPSILDIRNPEISENEKYNYLVEKTDNTIEKILTFNALPAAELKIDENHKNEIENCLLDSNKTLAELLRDGTELVTNVCVANDKREIDRRTKEAELREELLAKLQTESEDASNRFDVINERWAELENMKDPFDMYEGLEEQKLRIGELTKQKDEIIEECRKELDKADLRYYEDQQKQNADIECLVERIDRQIEVMKKSYKNHLDVLQKTIDKERTQIKVELTKQWNDMYEKQAECEEMKLKNTKEKAQFYDRELHRITLEHEELTRAMKIKLEKENEALQIELQRVKADVMLNSEKLDYNYQILKNREEENLIVKNQQKKRLNRLQETISKLRRKIRETNNKCETESKKLRAEIFKLQIQINEMENAADSFAEVNEKKFEGIWDMNFEKAKELFDKIMEIDKILHQQQLGIEWEEDKLVLLKKTDMRSYQEAIEILSKNTTIIKKFNINEPADNACSENMDMIVYRKIMEQIADRAGFLVEEKLENLLKPFTSGEKTIVKIDNILNALGVQTMATFASLEKFLQKYAFCPNCKNDIDSLDSSSYNDGNCLNHTLNIDSKFVLTALREYAENYLAHSSKAETQSAKCKSTESRYTISRLLTTENIKCYWEQFSKYFTPQKERLWHGMEYGFSEYLKVLKEREKLDTDCEQLKRQNEELKHLLQKYLPDEIN